jgi:hypothetical protein
MLWENFSDSTFSLNIKKRYRVMPSVSKTRTQCNYPSSYSNVATHLSNSLQIDPDLPSFQDLQSLSYRLINIDERSNPISTQIVSDNAIGRFARFH